MKSKSLYTLLFLSISHFSISQGELPLEEGISNSEDSVLIKKELFVNESAIIDGNLNVKGQLFTPELQQNEDTNIINGSFNLLVWNAQKQSLELSSNSSIQKSLGTILYSPPPNTSCDENSSDIQSPTWQNGPYKVFIPCPEIKVGIGTSIPAYSLHTNGKAYFTENIGVGIDPDNQTQLNIQSNKSIGLAVRHLYNLNDGYAIKSIVNNDLSKGFGIFNSAYNKDVFSFYGNGKMEISNSTGKILQLASDGLLRARKIRVDTEVWPDYVFSMEYDLMPLGELEKYVNDQKHLPNIPSENEIVEGGIDLGEMSVKLIEKMEELVLYTIQQNNQIEELQEEIKKLKEEMERIKNPK